MATLTEAQLAEASLWLDQHIAAARMIEQKAADAAKATWLDFTAWYSAAAVAAVAREMASLSNASQNMIVGSAQAYIGNVVAILRGTKVSIPAIDLPPIRNGAPLELVHTRPAERYKKGVATGMTPEQAEALAVYRAGDLQVQDMSLVEREAQQYQMRQLGITQFRRVVRPELSKTGSCGLCIVASDVIYNAAVLMPMHDRCKCLTIPIIGDLDPGNSLNGRDLGDFYTGLKSTQADELKKTRYEVNEHGEYGPTLTSYGQHFRGRDQVALKDDPKRAARELSKALPVLTRMESSGATADELAYQRDYVAQLTDAVAA